MTDYGALHIDEEIELGGILFARVKASFIDGTRFVGAHIDLDGNALGDTGLIETRISESIDGEHNDAIRCLRSTAAIAVKKAHAECGMPYTVADSIRTLELVARALPYQRPDDDA